MFFGLTMAARGAESALDSFTREVQPVLDEYCYDCHGRGLDKGGVVLDEFKTEVDIHDHKLWWRVMKNVRAGIMPPADEARVPPDAMKKLMTWIKLDAFSLDPAHPDPGRVTVRRLNRVEYRNTVRELIGVDFDTLKEFPADDTGQGFDNLGDVLTISPMLLERYLDAAQTIVSQAVPTQARIVAKQTLNGKQFATVKVESPATLPVPAGAAGTSPAPAAEKAAASVSTPVVVATAAPVPAVAAISTPAPAAISSSASIPATPALANAPANTPVVASATPVATPPTPAPKVFKRPVPTVHGDTLDLSYYTPSTVATNYQAVHSGKYQVGVKLTAVENYVDDQFDLNRCRLIFKADGKTLIDQEFVREGEKTFEFTFDCNWEPGAHPLTFEIQPIGPDRDQNRLLRLRLNAVTVSGPQAPEYWVQPENYAKFFPQKVPWWPASRQKYAGELLGNFATRAFRRPVDETTIKRLVTMAGNVAAQPGGTFEAGVAQAMVAVLASPRFIFREENVAPLQPGQTHPYIDEYALASRLSYFLWSSMPDDQLFHLAAQGQLRAQLPAQLARMLADPRAQEMVRNFTGQWLEARDIANVQVNGLAVYLREHPDPAVEKAIATFQRVNRVAEDKRTAEEKADFADARKTFFALFRTPKPQLTEPLREAMRRETEMTFDYVIKSDRSLVELIESDYTFLNEDLAKHYGVAGVTGAEMRKVMLPADSPRGGILTQGTVLAVTSNPTRTSPVKRGVFILDAILGTRPPPPPPNIPALEDAASPEKLRTMTLRENLALHATNKSCAACHSRMDPLGLALENFNALGKWRDAELNRPIDPAGKLITGETFANIRELKHVLATSHRRDFYYCFTEKLLTYALGRTLDYYDVDTVDQLVTALDASGGKPSVLLQGIVNSAPFQQTRQPAGTEVAADNSAPSSREKTNPSDSAHEELR